MKVLVIDPVDPEFPSDIGMDVKWATADNAIEVLSEHWPFDKVLLKLSHESDHIIWQFQLTRAPDPIVVGNTSVALLQLITGDAL